MARPAQDRSDTNLIRTILDPLSEPYAALRPGLDERTMIVAIRRAGITIAKKTVSRRDTERLVQRGWIRRAPPPSRDYVITFSGEQMLMRMKSAADRARDITPTETVETVSGARYLVNRRESPLMWLAHRKDADGRPLIDPLQLAAGERIRNDFTLAGLSPRMTVDWTRFGAGIMSGIGHPGLATDLMIAARQRLHRALDALGPDKAGLVLDLCCFLKGIGDVERERGWPQRSARKRFTAALSCLVTHYGLGAIGPDRATQIRIWAEPEEM